MTEVRHERTVTASPQAVWKLLADFDRIAEWAEPVDHSCALTARSEGVGAQRRVQMGTTVLLEEVTRWVPEEQLAYELVGLPPIVSRVENEWTLTPDGDRTTVALTAHITPGPRPPMRVAARLLGRRIGAENARLVDGLVAALERTHP